MITMGNFAGYKVKELCTWDIYKTVDMTIQKSFINRLESE